MAAVGVDNDASVVPECANGKLPVPCRRWCRRPTSIRHVVDYDRHLRRLRRHYEIRRDALLNGLQHNLTSIEVSRAADLRLLVRLVNAAGEPQRPTPDRPPHLDRTAEPLPTQLHRGRHRVERPQRCRHPTAAAPSLADAAMPARGSACGDRCPLSLPFRTEHLLGVVVNCPSVGLTDDFCAPCWSVRRIPTHGRLTQCGN
jgi:hypothetical protein